MSAETSDRARLGRYIQQRRVELGLSQAAAADQAGVNRATWDVLEKAVRKSSHDYIYGKVEQVLGWKAGSCEAILAGGDPPTAPVVDPVEVEIRGSGLALDIQEELIRVHAQQREELRKMIELFKRNR